MPGEIDIYGVYLPILLVLMLVAFVVSAVLKRVLAWTGFYALVWHRALFDLALYVIVLGGVSLLSQWFAS